MQQKNYKEILDQLKNKASLKREIYRSTAEVFGLTKAIVSRIAAKLHQDYTEKDPSVEINYKENNQFEAQMKFSGDMQMVSMHSNVLNFESGHSILKVVTLHQKQPIVAASGYPTGKRLGYLFNSEIQQNNTLTI